MTTVNSGVNIGTTSQIPGSVSNDGSSKPPPIPVPTKPPPVIKPSNAPAEILASSASTQSPAPPASTQSPAPPAPAQSLASKASNKQKPTETMSKEILAFEAMERSRSWIQTTEPTTVEKKYESLSNLQGKDGFANNERIKNSFNIANLGKAITEGGKRRDISIDFFLNGNLGDYDIDRDKMKCAIRETYINFGGNIPSELVENMPKDLYLEVMKDFAEIKIRRDATTFLPPVFATLSRFITHLMSGTCLKKDARPSYKPPTDKLEAALRNRDDRTAITKSEKYAMALLCRNKDGGIDKDKFDALKKEIPGFADLKPAECELPDYQKIKETSLMGKVENSIKNACGWFALILISTIIVGILIL